MDISYTNVLKGARQYFQGLPAASGASEHAASQDHHHHPPQPQLPTHNQQQHHPHRPCAPSSENDGSVRSEQHSAVPVYWDQQNEGQAAANLTNRDAPLTMSQQQHHHPPQPPPTAGSGGGGNGGRVPGAVPHLPNQTTTHPSSNNYPPYRTANGSSSASATHYHAHIPVAAAAAATSTKTYYDLQTSRAPKLYTTQSASVTMPSSETAGRIYTYPTTNPPPSAQSSYPPNSSSSSHDAQYNYKMYPSHSSSSSCHYQAGYYHPTTSQPPQPQQQQPNPQTDPHRRHLPVQPSNMYHHSSSRKVVPTPGFHNAPKFQPSNVPTKEPSYNVKTSTFNGTTAQPSYAYYSNGGYTPTNTYTTTISTVPRATYVNTPQQPSAVTNYPSRPVKTQSEYAPSPSPASMAVPSARMPVPKVKRESPLDLSVKTVRTSADSTLGDVEVWQYHRPVVRYDLTMPRYVSQARAPKVDFSPNFAMQERPQAPTIIQEHRVAPPAPPQQQPPQTQRGVGGGNDYYNYQYATSALPKVDFNFHQRKRSLEQASHSVIPEKVPKVDTWRQKMDQQIEQRFNSYAKQRPQVASQEGTSKPSAAPVLPNGAPTSISHYPHQQPPPQQHSQPLPPQQYAYYNNTSPNLGHKKVGKDPPTSTKPPATKKVLNLLRDSLQNKGAKSVTKKPVETTPSLPPPPRMYMEHVVLQPTTDVMAPLQPKPGIVGRRNVSPFTAASLERNSNTPPTYKFHIPKAIDSVIISDEGEKEQEASMGGDLDGLAAFLAARIRTKAELKQQVGPNEVSVGGGNTAGSNNNGGVSSPPKLKKEPVDVAQPQPASTAIPKKLFGRNEMKRAEVRSSSETSVFDFPDSDNEMEMPVLERQSLLNMRKDRKVMPNKPSTHNNTPSDASILEGCDSERPSSPFSLLFNQTCDSFVEQLMGGAGKKRGRRKKEDDPLAESTTLESEIEKDMSLEIKKEVVEGVTVKQEPLEALEDEVPQLSTAESAPPSVIETLKEEPKPFIPPTPAPVPPPEMDQSKHTDTDSDTPLVHLATKQKKKFTKKDTSGKVDKLKKSKKLDARVDKETASSDSEVEKFSRLPPPKDFYESLKAPITICKPGKKPTFGDGSDFRPGWEDALYRYKKSIRIPMQLIQVTRPPSSQRLSTSLPDLDPCPISPAPKTESIDSDMDSSNCSFSFAKHYDSDQGSMKSFSSSILDKLLVRVGAKKRKRMRKDDSHGPKIIPKSENELLPTPSLEIKDVIVKSTSALLGFRKKTVDNFKDAFINNSNKIVGVNEFNTVVLKARTRTETRVLKEKATIREVFGEDRPASAPPVTCVEELKPEEPSKGDKENQLRHQEFNDVLIESKINAEIKKEREDDNITVISNDSVEVGGGKKRNKLRRKLSSGFDYIRKKKKQIKKEDTGGEDTQVKTKRRGLPSKATPESVDDIQKEIKQWVLNKGVGETHLHRASRSGFTDITAYCLEKMMCNPSPKDNAGYTPLHEACSRGHLDIARLLLQYGAHVSESASGGIRPLHEAAENGYVEIIRLLLSYGADPSLATYTGTTPLQLASDETTIAILQEHLDELQGKSQIPWLFNGPASIFDGCNEGFDPLSDVPESEPQSEAEDIEFEISEYLLPNLYTLPECEPTDRWVILQDLSNALKIKSKETLLRQLNISAAAKSDLIKDMKMSDFLEKAHCCQFMNANEKLNTRQSKICFVKYTDKVKRLLNVENHKFPKVMMHNVGDAR